LSVHINTSWIKSSISWTNRKAYFSNRIPNLAFWATAKVSSHNESLISFASAWTSLDCCIIYSSSWAWYTWFSCCTIIRSSYWASSTKSNPIYSIFKKSSCQTSFHIVFQFYISPRLCPKLILKWILFEISFSFWNRSFHITIIPKS